MTTVTCVVAMLSGCGDEGSGESGSTLVDQDAEVGNGGIRSQDRNDGGGVSRDDAGASIDGYESCGYTLTRRSACSGDSFVRKTTNPSRCVEDVDYATCRADQPADRDQEDSTCFLNEDYDFWSFVGTCADWDAYWDDELDCLMDRNCTAPEGMRASCVNHVCLCDGAACPVLMPGNPDGPDAGARQDGGVTSGDAGTATPEGGTPGAPGVPEGGITTFPDAAAPQDASVPPPDASNPMPPGPAFSGASAATGVAAIGG
jgi:hypothetical protein